LQPQVVRSSADGEQQFDSFVASNELGRPGAAVWTAKGGPDACRHIILTCRCSATGAAIFIV